MKSLKKLCSILILTFALSSLIIVSCARNPVTGKQEFMLLSENDEIKMGQAVDKSVVQMYGIYDDAELAGYLDGIGQKMAKISHRPHLKYEFKVMDSPVINAFAVPGGYIYITRGILAYLNSEAELAGVVGHEIGHVTARHSAKKYSEVSLAQLGLGIGSMISQDFAKFSGLAAQGIGLIFLKFSRDDERQSDQLGVEYASKVGYDAGEMANFFNTLDKMQSESKQTGLPDWFSTHPNPADRVADVRQQAEKKQKELGNQKLIINRDGYLSKINGVVFGENPRQGFVDNNVFYHPDMKFMFPIPAGWELNNLLSQVQMVDANQKGIMIFTLAQGKSALAASQEYIKNTKAKVVSEDNIKVNGLISRKVFSEIADGQNILRVQSYFIEKSGQVFAFHGFSQQSFFNDYQASFTRTMQGFKTLKDKKKLNIKPDRIKITKVTRANSLKNILSKMGITDEEQEQIALLNGLNLTDRVKANKRIKTIEKGR